MLLAEVKEPRAHGSPGKQWNISLPCRISLSTALRLSPLEKNVSVHLFLIIVREATLTICKTICNSSKVGEKRDSLATEGLAVVKLR